MKSIITTMRTSAYTALIFVAIATAIFGASVFAPTVFAQSYNDYYDYGYGTSGGDFFDFSYFDTTSSYLDTTPSYSYNDYYDYGYGTSGGDVIDNGCCDAPVTDFSYLYNDYYDNGYGTSGGDVIDNGCCDQVDLFANYSYNDYYDNGYGTSGGDVIDNGCCDAPIDEPTQVADQTEPWTPVEYDPIIWDDEPVYYDYGDELAYTDYYPDYFTSYDYGVGGAYTYSTPTYTPYTYPTVTTGTSRPTCTFYASRNTIEDGESTRLTWSTTGATNVSINNSIGLVARDGSRSVSPSSSRTYVLTATGAGGSVTCSNSITVGDNTTNNNNVSCDAFTVSDSRVDEGDRVTLEWRTTGANDVSINNGVGDVANDGSERVTVDEDTTFTLTARNGSDTDTCRVEVNVDTDNTTRRNTNDIPRCTLRISDTQIASGENVTLSWENLRTDRLILRDSHGRELADSRTDRRIDEDRDSISVRPTQSTDYTLTVYNGSTRRTCTVGTTVGGVTLTSVRAQDGISLTQVPYTGFEAGPVLTMIFYAAIVLWGLVMAYVLVMKKQDVPAVASAHHVVAAHAPTVATHTDVFAEPVHNSAPANLPTFDDVDLHVEDVQGEDMLRTLEAYAHSQYALISSDALRLIESQGGNSEEHIQTLERVIALAKATFPKENDWVILNKERVMSLLG